MKLKWIYIIVALVAFVLYANTLKHEFVWDDQIVITLNSVTSKGFDGLKEIWTTENYIQDRPTYRPVPQTYFATLWQFFPDNPLPFHVGTVLLYALCCFSFLFVLKHFFPNLDNWLLLFIGLYFVLLPVHSEVVANNKSSDELLSAIFVLWSLYFADKKATKYLIVALLLFAFALLSKLSALTVAPILLYLFLRSNNRFNTISQYFEKNITIINQVLTITCFLFLLVLTKYTTWWLDLFHFPLLLLLLLYAKKNFSPKVLIIITLIVGAYLYYIGNKFLIPFYIFYTLFSLSKEYFNFKNIFFLAFVIGGSILMFLSKTYIAIVFLICIFVILAYYKNDEKLNWKILLPISVLPIIISLGWIIVTKNFPQVTTLVVLFLPLFLLLKRKYKLHWLFLVFLATLTIFEYHIHKSNYNNDFEYIFTAHKTTNENSTNEVNTDPTKRVFENQPYHNILVSAPDLATKSATILKIQLIYLQKLIFPVHLVHQHGAWQIKFATWKNWEVYLSIIVHLALLYLLYFFYKKKYYLLFWSLVWYFLTISIYTNIVRLMPDTLAERFLFLPSMGFCVLMVVGVFKLFSSFIKDQKNIKIILAVCLAPLFVYFSYKVYNRNKAWKSNYDLSLRTLPYAPNNAAINAQYAVELRNLVKYNLVENKDSVNALAVEHYKKSIEIFPEFYGPYSDLAVYYILQADPNNAYPYLKKATELKPEEWIHFYYLGLIHYERKKYADAIVDFDAVINNYDINKKPLENPELKDAYEYKGRCLFNLGKVDEATATMEKAIERFNDKTSYILLGNTYRKSGKKDKAIETFERLLQQNPNDEKLRNTIELLKEGKIY
ncbi:MAG: tetratricopeptide repeat protein [Chitinophagales bacterium]|nr:tetratricopeptide repeat protein [Chitinophagales bacterium]